MTNFIFHGSMGGTGGPLTSTLVSIDGSFVLAIGLAVLLAGGILLSAALQRRRVRRRVAVRGAMALRRAAA
jgi:Flp pilus assembly protein protease CpaA